MIFIKMKHLSEKILEISSDDKKEKMIAKKDKEKYMKYFEFKHFQNLLINH